MNYSIDPNVPIPARRGRLPKAQWKKWPFAELEVGWSVSLQGHPNTVRAAATEFSLHNRPKRFLCRWFDEDPITKLPGTRVWRIR